MSFKNILFLCLVIAFIIPPTPAKDGFIDCRQCGHGEFPDCDSGTVPKKLCPLNPSHVCRVDFIGSKLRKSCYEGWVISAGGCIPDSDGKGYLCNTPDCDWSDDLVDVCKTVVPSVLPTTTTDAPTTVPSTKKPIRKCRQCGRLGQPVCSSSLLPTDCTRYDTSCHVHISSDNVVIKRCYDRIPDGGDCEILNVNHDNPSYMCTKFDCDKEDDPEKGCDDHPTPPPPKPPANSTDAPTTTVTEKPKKTSPTKTAKPATPPTIPTTACEAKYKETGLLCIVSTDSRLHGLPTYKYYFPTIMSYWEHQLKAGFAEPRLLPMKGSNPPKHDDDLHWIDILDIKLNVSRVVNNQYVDPTSAMGSGLTMNQWKHIVIKVNPAFGHIKALFVQAIHGPLGLPFGNFKKFPGVKKGEYCTCNDCKFISNEHKNYMSLPCTTKPKASIEHPEVLFWSGSAEEVHFNFNFVDMPCHRARQIKFIVYAVTSSHPWGVFVETETLFRERDSKDGIPYPYHPDFCNALSCGGCSDPTSSSASFTPQAPDKLRRSLEYSECNEGKRGGKNDVHAACPPEAFKCDADFHTVEKDEKYSFDPKCDCGTSDGSVDGHVAFETPPPDVIYPSTAGSWLDLDPLVTEGARPDTGPGIDEALKLLDEETFGSVKEEAIAAWLINDLIRMFHGILMYASFGVINSVSLFFARFGKDLLPGYECSSKAVWLWVHIVLAGLTFALMYSGLGILFLTSETSPKILHKMLGFIAVALFNLNFLFGWTVPIGPRLRCWCIGFHSIFGYAAAILAACSMAIISVGRAWYFFSLIATVEGLNLAFFIFGTFIQRGSDSAMELTTKRRYCPYVDFIRLPARVPKLYRILRRILFILHISLLTAALVVGLILWPAGAYHRSYFDITEPGNWEDKDPK